MDHMYNSMSGHTVIICAPLSKCKGNLVGCRHEGRSPNALPISGRAAGRSVWIGVLARMTADTEVGNQERFDVIRSSDL